MPCKFNAFVDPILVQDNAGQRSDHFHLVGTEEVGPDVGIAAEDNGVCIVTHKERACISTNQHLDLQRIHHKIPLLKFI